MIVAVAAAPSYVQTGVSRSSRFAGEFEVIVRTCCSYEFAYAGRA